MNDKGIVLLKSLCKILGKTNKEGTERNRRDNAFVKNFETWQNIMQCRDVMS